jgi:hypothetical protein
MFARIGGPDEFQAVLRSRLSARTTLVGRMLCQQIGKVIFHIILIQTATSSLGIRIDHLRLPPPYGCPLSVWCPCVRVSVCLCVCHLTKCRRGERGDGGERGERVERGWSGVERG